MLKGSIRDYIKEAGSILTDNILTASVNNVIKLKASVAEFVISLSTRAIILIKVKLDVVVKLYRRITNVSIVDKISVIVRAKVFKKAKSLISERLQLTIRAMTYKVIIPTIGIDTVIGTSSNLNSIKSLSLSDIKLLTLRELRFTMGVLANIVRVLGIVPINIKTQIDVSAVTIRKNTLGDIKGFTLGEIKTLALKELAEYEV